MAETATTSEGVERVQEVFRNIDREFKKVQEKLNAQTEKIQDQLTEQRKNLEEKTQAEWEKFKGTSIGKRADELSSATTKRAEELKDKASKGIESGFENVLDVLHLASKNDVVKLEKKLQTLNRKIKALEKGDKPAAKRTATKKAN